MFSPEGLQRNCVEGGFFPRPGHSVGDERHKRVKKRHSLHFSEISFLWKALNISALPELILHGIQIAKTYNRVIEILKSSFR
jgi:hypothetical protein